MGSDDTVIRYLSDWQGTLDMIHHNVTHYYQFNYASLPEAYQGDLSITVTPLNFKHVDQSHVVIAVFNQYFQIYSNDESAIQTQVDEHNTNNPDNIVTWFYWDSSDQIKIDEHNLTNTVYFIAIRLKKDYKEGNTSQHYDFEYSITVGTDVAQNSISVDQLTIGTPTTNTVKLSSMHVYAVEMMRDEIFTLFVYSHKNVSLSILVDNYNNDNTYPRLV